MRNQLKEAIRAFWLYATCRGKKSIDEFAYSCSKSTHGDKCALHFVDRCCTSSHKCDPSCVLVWSLGYPRIFSSSTRVHSYPFFFQPAICIHWVRTYIVAELGRYSWRSDNELLKSLRFLDGIVREILMQFECMRWIMCVQLSVNCNKDAEFWMTASHELIHANAQIQRRRNVSSFI